MLDKGFFSRDVDADHAHEANRTRPVTRPQISPACVLLSGMMKDEMTTLGCPAAGADFGSGTRGAAASVAANPARADDS